MLQNPTAESMQGFREYWLKYWAKNKPYLNLYCVVDSASTKKKDSDYTVMAIIGTDSLRNFYLVDMIRDKLNLKEKWDKLKYLVRQWGIREVGYERFGAQSDVEYYNQMMEEEGCYFNIIELSSNVAKTDRIKRLVPLFQGGRFIIPRALPYQDINGEYHDLTTEFINEEYLSFPYAKHDDILDCLSRILDSGMRITFPTRRDLIQQEGPVYNPLLTEDYSGTSWMIA
jgi:predicted phage terminase large subunit-like protein